jgi:serine acetyltransferase
MGERYGGDNRCPRLEDHVIICPHCVLLGDILIGHHSIIGAGSVVLESCPPFSVMVGNPARVLNKKQRE